ncbi:bifunctional transcriptional activator/DNA repair enzyme AdaA [Zavarzinia sp. CC-PAN008]|uniref:bifunctional transcriptional activator/DNA repair enzyme AdaA n=1 Tax=Zavarzinia sp. CC-PAN008 TaxID=3243332 RepID=UPI003F743DF2
MNLILPKAWPDRGLIGGAAPLPAAANPTPEHKLVVQALAYIEAHRLEQPSLEDVALQVGLSPYHLQRLFVRWVGISPKRYLAALTLDHARQLLADRASVLDAALDCGLSGPGRLHDLFVSIDAMTPGEYKAEGRGMTVRWGWHPSPFGDCLIMATARGVCGLAFADQHKGHDAAFADLSAQWSAAHLVRDQEATAPLAEATFHGRPVSLLLKGTPFQLKVWEALLRIPLGSTVSYSDIAQASGCPAAVRATASAIGANPVSFLVPCHRVLRRSGELGGYRWGLNRKRAILDFEAGWLGESVDGSSDAAGADNVGHIIEAERAILQP